MSRTVTIIIGFLIVLILVGFNTTYSVNFHQLAIKTRFGKPVEIIREPGLHFKAPVLHRSDHQPRHQEATDRFSARDRAHQ